TELAVTYVTGSGTFSNTDALTVQFVRTGDQGAGDLVAANNLSDVANAATAFTNIKQAATASATGVVELATDAETITGTDTARAVTPANVAAAAVAKTGGTMTGDLTMSGASIFDANASIAAHATTMDPWSLGNYVTLTGVAVTFSAMANAPQAGAEVELYMNAAHIFTDGAVFEVDGDANFTAEAGDRVLLRAKSTTVFTVHPRKKTGQAVGAPAAASDTAAGIVELATVAETKAGTDTARVVTPDSLAEGGQLDGVPGTDHTANGPQTNSFVANGSSTVMDLVYLNSTSKWASADASAATTAGGVMLAISLATKSADEAMNVALPGSFVRDDTWNWTPGDELYVSETAAAITATAPTTTDAVVRVVGWAVTADVIYFNPSSSWITVT
ncbi:MAG: hypothetical protein Q8P46_03700, partial [Hyphomicrobiales bacterium]|nr:hypothetical protein [Hyphomicrobiales bacterium]